MLSGNPNFDEVSQFRISEALTDPLWSFRGHPHQSVKRQVLIADSSSLA